MLEKDAGLRVMEEMKGVEGVKEIYTLYGEYGGALIFRVNLMGELESIMRRLRAIRGVTKTCTMIAEYVLSELA